MGSARSSRGLQSMKMAAVLSAVLTALLQMHLISCRGTVHCGPAVGLCPDSQCCGSNNQCGVTTSFCGDGCQSGPCWNMNQLSFPESQAAHQKSSSAVHKLVTAEVFDHLFPQRNAFYTREAFLAAADAFPEFGTVGSAAAQRRDVAAFFAHVHHETAGLTEVPEAGNSDESADFCFENSPPVKFSCVPGKKYFPRGPLELTWNYNYGSASKALGVDLLANPELLSKDAVLSFKSALWVWMSASADKMPSSHEVMVGRWSPSAEDMSANRLQGFGTTIDILQGAAECGHESVAAEARTEKYLYVAKMFHVSAGQHLQCTTMLPF